MSAIKLNSSGGGSITISPASTASTLTLTVPANTGNLISSADSGTVSQAMLAAGVAGNGPAFSAYQNSAQGNITSAVFTKIIFDTEEFDTNNNFASSRFTPSVAGYYQLNSSIRVDGSPTRIIVSIYKNGSYYKAGTDTPTNSSQGIVSAVVYANGTTDYFEVYVYATSTGTPTLSSTGTASIWFNGALVRAA